MSEIFSSNKRIAKNTIMLYIRMLFSIIVGLYTSRVVLSTLGVEDYGIYGVVGGIISAFSFLNASMAGSTSRFLTFELGKEEKESLKHTFSSSLIIHIGIAMFILLLSETIGLWFLYNKLVIPETRLDAAFWVFQFSVLSMLISVTQVPYNAVIIAHEKMDIYAYIELLHVFLKLGIVYLLLIGDFDKLIFYAALVFAVSFLIAMIYRIYCLNHFIESKFQWIWQPNILKPMLNFSGWDLFGNFSVTITLQGYQFAMNILVGPILNAANNVANTVQGTIKGLSYAVIQAYRPQIIKKYAKGDIEQMELLVFDASKICLIMLFFLSLPCYWEIDYILKLWLVNPPTYTNTLLRISLISLFFNMANIVINIPIHATGHIKELSIYTGICYTLSPFVFYFIVKCGISVYLAYWTIVIINILTLCITIIIVKHLIHEFNVLKLIVGCYIPFIPLIVLDSAIIYLIKQNYSESLIRLFIEIIVSCITISVYAYLVMTTASQRKNISQLIKEKFHKISSIK